MSSGLTQLEIDYSPSRWSKRFPNGQVIEHYINFIQKESERSRQLTENSLDNTCGSHAVPKYDIYGTNLPKDSPILIFIHGGYWQEHDKNDSCYMAATLAKNGIKTIVVGFNLCPKVTLKAQVDEVTTAVTYILDLAEKWGTKRICIAGHSSGAHLVACLFKTMADKINSNTKFLLISGIYDLRPLCDTYANAALHLTEETAGQLSPQLWSSSDFHVSEVNMWVIIPEDDSPAFKHQSVEFAVKLQELNANVVVVQLENVDHFDVVERLVEDDFEVTKLLCDILNK